MKSMMKILTRYVISAAGVTLVLLIVNFSVLATWAFQSVQITHKDYSISQLANGLSKADGAYKLSGSVEKEIKNKYQWAMLISDAGNVIWSENLPDDIPVKYTVSDVASLTRWYLKDYPVYVWRHPDGLFVLGSEKGSIWKHDMEMPETVMDNTLALVPVVLALNGVAAVLLALIFGMRLFRSLKPLAKGIEDMAQKRTVELSTNGLLGDLAEGINKTSAQLTKQEAALNKRDNARTTWIAGVSHDIRTPLSLVMGYASQLENDSELPQGKREQAGIIRRQSERIKTLVSDLNLASKLEYDMQPFRQESVALAPLLRITAADFINSGLSDNYSFDIIISKDAQNVMISGDEELLRRAVSNLILNSIRHNPNGSDIKITLEKDLGNCALSVSDNGTGFTQETLHYLNDSKSLIEPQNHGLGLIIVRQVIKAHGGFTEFRNLPDGGCSVVLSLPVSNMI